MKDDPLPDADHISRYCSFTTLAQDGRPTQVAFHPRGHGFVSVNWLEHTGFITRSEQLEAVRVAAAAKGLRLRAQGKLAVLRNGDVISHIHTTTKQQINITHQPEAPQDPTHSGIFYPLSEPAYLEFLATRVAERVIELHAATSGT